MAYWPRRLIAGIFTVVGAITLMFVVLRVIPGNPALVILGDRYTGQAFHQLVHQLGLDQPLYVQYLAYLGGILHGNLGVSFQTQAPVLSTIMSQLPYTMELAAAAIVISATLGVLLGMVAAINRNRALDQVSMVVALLGAAMPGFWFGILLMELFAIKLGVLPMLGVGSGGVGSTLVHLILPAMAVGIRDAGLNARLTRSAILDVIKRDFIRTARAKGLPERVVLYRHALRNALLPVFTSVGLSVGRMLGGTVVTEIVFSRPGVGRLLVDAVMSRDYPIVQGVLLVYVVLIIVLNIFVDVAYVGIDPRIRYQ